MSSVIYTSASCITPSTIQPIDAEYAKLHLRSLSDVEDELIDAWIMAATQYFEEQTGRPIMKATWEYWLDAFPWGTKIELPHPPLVSVSSVTYIASDGTSTSFDDGASPATTLWRVNAPSGVYARRGWIEPLTGSVWPSGVITEYAGAVRIRYVAGYADTSDEVPAIIKAALLLLVGHFEQFRSEVHAGESLQELPFGAAQIMDAFKHSAKSSQVLHRLW